MIDFLRKIVMRIATKKNAMLKYPVSKQIEYLNTFKIPKDDIQRSYFQYLCQKKLMGRTYSFIANICAAFVIMPYIIRARWKNARLSTQDNIINSNEIFFTNGIDVKYLPDQIDRDNLYLCEITDGVCLNSKDILFILGICKRYPFSFYFLFKTIIKIASYRYQINKKRPQKIIVSAEYSFTSSIMTMYCEKNNIEHINIQHGEKVLYIEDAFFRFHKCYFWDSYYINIMLKLKAEEKQFIVFTPQYFKTIKKDVEDLRKLENKCFEYIYYLANENENELKKIKEIFVEIIGKERSFILRPHPKVTNKALVNKIMGDVFSIEDTKDISIERSLARCKCAVSLRSLVLQQADICGINIVIDDISNKDSYEVLKENGYRYVYKSKKLSDIVKEKTKTKNTKEV